MLFTTSLVDNESQKLKLYWIPCDSSYAKGTLILQILLTLSSGVILYNMYYLTTAMVKTYIDKSYKNIYFKNILFIFIIINMYVVP